jgi:hypothetical protein
MYEENQTELFETAPISRRDFALTSLMTGFAFAVQPMNASKR